MAGKLYGVGVGPGEGVLLTLKAKAVLESVDIIAVPVKAAGEESRALKIIEPVVRLEGKEILPLIFSMEAPIEQRKICRQAVGKMICERLDQGANVAMINLGDISVYSTYHQMYKYIKDKGYEAETIPGITSFSAGAALAGLSLVEGNEGMMVISSLKGPDTLTDALKVCDNIVVMKAGSTMDRVMDQLEAEGLFEHTLVLSNVGMEGEYIGPLQRGRSYGYFTTLIIKKGGLK